MGSTFGSGLNMYDTYFGGGAYSSSGYTRAAGGYGYGNSTVASSSALKRITRDIAQGYTSGIETVNLYLEKGDVNGAIAAYEELLEEAKTTANNYGYQLTDGQIASAIDNAYKSVTGMSFKTNACDECHSPFVTGLAEGLPVIGCFVNGNSDAEAISKISKTRTRAIDKAAETLGAVITNAGSYAAIGAVVGGGVPGAIIGGAIGAVVGIGKTIIKGR